MNELKKSQYEIALQKLIDNAKKWSKEHPFDDALELAGLDKETCATLKTKAKTYKKQIYQKVCTNLSFYYPDTHIEVAKLLAKHTANSLVYPILLPTKKPYDTLGKDISPALFVSVYGLAQTTGIVYATPVIKIMSIMVLDLPVPDPVTLLNKVASCGATVAELNNIVGVKLPAAKALTKSDYNTMIENVTLSQLNGALKAENRDLRDQLTKLSSTHWKTNLSEG